MANYASVIEGLNIFAKYSKDGLNTQMCAEHDIIYAFPNDPSNEISEEDKAKLDKLGWHIDSYSDYWGMFT